MKKKKYVCPRRRKALFRCAVCLVLAVLLLLVQDYGFTRAGAIGDAEKHYGTTGLETLCDLPSPTLGDGSKWECSLRGSEDALMYTAIRFRLLSGWQREMCAVLDCSDKSKQAHVSLHDFTSQSDDSHRYTALFGRLDDPSISRVEILFEYGAFPDDLVSDSLTTSEFISVGNYRYFFMERVSEYNDPDYTRYTTINCYDSEGELIFTDKISSSTYTSIG